MAEIEYDSVLKIYDDGTQAVHDLNLEIGDGELMVLVGPSGCGKTTALRMLAGLAESSGGELQIEEFLKRKPRALSGGQRQRVAMGRAIVREPQAFLMDEPLSNLDAKLRVQMRAEIHQLQRRLGVTTIYVTHDQVEAMTMGDRVAVMNAGHLLQVDTPQVLYDHPVNEFVAGFIGSPSINLVEAELAQQNGGLAVKFGDHMLTVDDQVARNRSGLSKYVGRTVLLGIRPEDFEDASIESDTPPDRRLKVTADLTEPLGSEVLVYFRSKATGVVSSAVTADAGADAEVTLGG